MKTVLVADDTKNIRTLVCKCLQMEGFRPVEASEGRQALELLRTQRFDLAFLDIKMPGMSGTEVLKTARAAGVRTPVVIITAYATVKNAVECTQLGAVAYLHKPFTADKLRSVLAELKEETDARGKAARLLAAGQAEEALQALKKALPENPLDPEVYLLLSQASEKLGLSEDAVSYRKLYDSLAH